MLNVLLIIYAVIGGMLWSATLAICAIASSPAYRGTKHLIPIFFSLPVFIFLWPLVIAWLIFMKD